MRVIISVVLLATSVFLLYGALFGDIGKQSRKSASEVVKAACACLVGLLAIILASNIWLRWIPAGYLGKHLHWQPGWLRHVDGAWCALMGCFLLVLGVKSLWSSRH